jgi:ribonuclease P protein component
MRAERLRRTKDIEIVRHDGALRTDPHFSIRSRRNGLDVIRVAVASPRAIGGSVKRNRARRRVREAIRDLLRERRAAPGTDLFVVARAPALDAPAPALRAAVARELAAILGPERA